MREPLESAWRDLRQGVRLLRRQPGFAWATIAVLASGIAATTAMFSITYGVLLRDLPYGSPERLVSLSASSRGVPNQRAVAGAADYYDWRARQQVFEDLALTRPVGSFNLTGTGEPERLAGARVTASLCAALGVTPMIGRCFTEAEEHDPERASAAAILSYALWQRRFGGDPAIVGRTIQLNGRAHEVVGVMGPAFRYPSREFEIWTPLYIPPRALAGRADYSYLAVGRLRPNLTIEQARAHMAVIADSLAREHPATNRDTGVVVTPLLSQITGGVRRTLWVLLGAVGVLFLISAFSIANLLIAQSAGRAPEFAVRATLGASRRRLARQLVMERLPLAVLGAAAGTFGAKLLLQRLLPLLPATLPRVEEIGLHWPVLAAAVALAIAATAVMGLGSAWAVRPELRRGPGAWARLRDGLVTLQLAGTVVLLVGAALLVNSFARVRAVDPGLDATQVLSLHLAVDRSTHGDDAGVARYLGRLVDAVQALPGVASAGLVNRLPLGGQVQAGDIRIDGLEQPIGTGWRSISAGYFRTLRVPIVAGRDFDAHDTVDAPLVGLADERLAALVPGGTLVGRRFRMDFPGQPWVEIVGVVGHVRDEGLDRVSRPLVYWHYPQRTQDRMAMVVRAEGDAAAIAGAVRTAIRAIDPNQPLYDVRPMTAVIDRSVEGYRLNAVLTGAFAALALTLAGTGLFGVLSSLALRRRREFGLRLALGATHAQLAAIVLRQGLGRAALGLAAGFGAAWLLTGLLGSMLYGVAPFDGAAYAAVAAVLVGVALAACLLPAWRAARVDPITSLKAD
jgi:putative ABC transport system permease protein